MYCPHYERDISSQENTNLIANLRSPRNEAHTPLPRHSKPQALDRCFEGYLHLAIYAARLPDLQAVQGQFPFERGLIWQRWRTTRSGIDEESEYRSVILKRRFHDASVILA